MIDGITAAEHLPGRLEECSRRVGWSSLLLRRYQEPVSTDAFETAPTPGQLIVLVRSGSTSLESFRSGRWHRTEYAPGDLGLTPQGETARLRWAGMERHITLQLHLPDALMTRARDEVRDHLGRSAARLSMLCTQDPVVRSTLLALERAVEHGLPDLYAEHAAHFLALHLICWGSTSTRETGRDSKLLGRVEDYMRANLANPISLADLAGVIDRSTFQLIRLARRGWGQTPFDYLTRLRMEHARRLLDTTDMSTMAIAIECGYNNPSHFATAFRRLSGYSPTEYRDLGHE
ncbi:AraC family transcriptional regulator [Novosphingobium sp.]|uniref:AraC family transcriptional regulator n=1 Tax=Novosphingobium sp. TaxID=1874826 RepID=UPI002FDE4E73